MRKFIQRFTLVTFVHQRTEVAFTFREQGFGAVEFDDLAFVKDQLQIQSKVGTDESSENKGDAQFYRSL